MVLQLLHSNLLQLIESSEQEKKGNAIPIEVIRKVAAELIFAVAYLSYSLVVMHLDTLVDTLTIIE